MRTSYPVAFALTIGLEGKPSNDPNDPGGFTIWGLAKRWHPTINPATTLDEARNIYLYEYWVPAGCDSAEFPLDICLFDSQVNPQNDPKLPGGGNKEIMDLGPKNWAEYNLLRASRYMRCSKEMYVKGHIFRVLKLSDQINSMLKVKRG